MEGLVDCHAHLAALPDGQNGAFVSEAMRRGAVFRFVTRAMGLSPSEPERTNRLFCERFARTVRESRRIRQAVALALDGAYGPDGRFDPSRTGLMVPNDLVYEACALHPQLLPGASINPSRRDALDELDRAAEQGAVLVKWLPNAMWFDPADPRHAAFWKKAAGRGLPILTHVGSEFAVTGSRQEWGDPARLRPMLRAGVTVIGAHGGSSGRMFAEPYLATVLSLLDEFPRFFLDSSALTLPNRLGMLRRIADPSSDAHRLAPRLLFGTDFPMPVTSWPLLRAARPGAAWRAQRTKNPFDRQAYVLEAMGLAPDPVLSSRVLRIRGGQAATATRTPRRAASRASRAKA